VSLPQSSIIDQIADHRDELLNENRQLKQRIKRLEEELERTKQDRNAIAKKTREPLLLKLDRAAERIKRLEQAGDAMVETTTTPAAEAWNKAKEAKP
jgi:cell division septum initiation protein DivIVA